MKSQEKVLYEKLQTEKILNYRTKRVGKISQSARGAKNWEKTPTITLPPPTPSKVAFLVVSTTCEVSSKDLPSSKDVSVKRKEFVQLVFKSQGTEKGQAHPYKTLQEY